MQVLQGLQLSHFFGDAVIGGDALPIRKPDARHLTSVVEIVGGDLKKSIMIGDSDVDAKSAENASFPFVLLEDGYTDVKVSQIKHDHLIKNFHGLDNFIIKYL